MAEIQFVVALVLATLLKGVCARAADVRLSLAWADVTSPSRKVSGFVSQLG
jgi:hypothetical protein